MPPVAQWHFREFRPGDNASDPDFARALFSRDESAEARSLVREAIQNSLDARASGGTTDIRVRFAVRDGAHSASGAELRRYFDSSWPHLESSNNGLDEPPTRADRVPYLVVEDFGTRGLTGDPATWDPFEAQRNSFFLFFRALGRSGKEGEDRGRWGVGKFVFPMASRAHCLLAMTVRETDSRRMIMGRMVLRTHRSQERSYHPDGQWGARGDNNLVLPLESHDDIEAFRSTFSLQRTDQPGLSVVVPWIGSGMSTDAISEAVAGEYFLPIFRGELSVEIDHNEYVHIVDSDRLPEIANAISNPLVRARVTLGQEAATWPAVTLLEARRPAAGSDLEWGADRLSAETRQQATQLLESGNAAAFRVYTSVRPKNAASRETHFDVFLQQVSGLGRSRPLIVREGITVSEDKTGFLQDYASLIVIDDAALASFVGDAETPAHTELQADLVKAKYTYAGKIIQLIRTAPASIVRELEGADREADHSILADFFPRPEPEQPERPVSPRDAALGDVVVEVPPIPNQPARFRIAKVDAGFSIRGTGSAIAGTQLTILCAYDIRRGNALRKYRTMDFAFGRDIATRSTGLSITSSADNRIEAEVDDPHFELVADGFDKNRNVVVQVSAEAPGASE